MANFSFHDPSSAPAESRPLLEGAIRQLGFLPALFAGLAESPAALKAYMDTSQSFAGSSLSAVEQQVVLLAVSAANGCEFCVAAHSFIARNMVKVPSPVVDGLRAGGQLPDPRLQALAKFTRRVVAERGWVADAAVDEFLAAGFNRAQALDVVLGVSLKTLSNYANHLMKTPTNAELASEAWRKPAAA